MLVPVSGNASSAYANRRTRANIPSMMKDQDPKKFPPIYIFNTYNRQHVIHHGSWGQKLIPACTPGEDYSTPLILKAIEIQEYDLADGAGNMGFVAEDGIELARDIIGVNSPGKALGLFTTDLEWLGVFATTNQTPTDAELKAAKGKLSRWMRIVYDDGAKLAASGPKGLDQIQENHNVAAQFLGIKNPPWLTVLPAQEGVEKCPQCLEEVQIGAKFCKHCRQAIEREPKKAKA